MVGLNTKLLVLGSAAMSALILLVTAALVERQVSGAVAPSFLMTTRTNNHVADADADCATGGTRNRVLVSDCDDICMHLILD